MQELLGDAARARSLLQEAGFRFSRSLGQNFLLDDGWNRRIAQIAGAAPGVNVLEIGPGAGTLTAALARAGARVLAVEIDTALTPILEKMLESFPDAQVTYGDITKQEIPALVDAAFGAGAPYRVASNLPYAIAAELLPRLVSGTRPPESVTAMVQKEAADRMQARPGEKNWCALAARMQYFCAMETEAILPPHAFTPNAHVESALIACRVLPAEERPARPSSEKTFLACIDAAFAMRRKTYANNLAGAFGITKAAAAEILAALGLPPAVRGETLSLETLARVSDALTAMPH